MDSNADPSYKDGFKRCIDEIAQVIISTPINDEVKRHLLGQLQLLNLGQEKGYSPLTPEYEHTELHNKYTMIAQSSNFHQHHHHQHNLKPSSTPVTTNTTTLSLFPKMQHQTLSPLSTHTSPNTINHSSSSPFEPASAFSSNAPVNTKTIIKQEIRSPEVGNNSNNTNKIWRPW